MEPGQRAWETWCKIMPAGRHAARWDQLSTDSHTRWAAFEESCPPAPPADVAALVERLQTKQRDWIAADEMMHDAASTIRALVAENERLKAENVALRQAALTHVKLQNKAEAKLRASDALLREAVEVIKAVQQCCFFDDDDGAIGVSEDVVIPSDLFNRICDFLATMAQHKVEKPSDP